MRIAVLIGSAVVALLTVFTGFADAKPEARVPAVRIAQLSPVVVTGEKFRSRERVVVRANSAGETHKRVIRTSRRGTFVVRFETMSVDRCSGDLSVFVTAPGGRVAKTRMPEFYCPPAIP